MSRPARSWTERSVTVDGVRIVFDESAGADPALVVLHGFLGSGASMVPLIEALDAHGALAGRRVVTVDLVGHGRSDAPAAVDPYSLEWVVHQLAGVLDAVTPGAGAAPGDVPVDLLGYSMGGRIALALALAFPRRFCRLVLIGATAGIEDHAERRTRRAADADLAAFVDQRGIDAFVDRWEQLPIFATQAGLAPEIRARVRAGRTAQSEVGVANSLRGTGTGSMAPMWDRLATLAVPTLLLAGALDTKYVEIGGRLADVLPAGRFLAIADAGHAAHVEKPEVTASAVGEFLGELGAADGAGAPTW
ncbi:MAG: 2-succinyl-6-hydroxy-2,4-cyclohexadiene-1-carboxylate synthase [Acidimicrobiales bacterium]